jgi:uncharacterized membrane protein
VTYPRWTWLTTFPLAILGLADAVYLSVEHATNSKSFACPNSATINCVKVTTSSYATLAGIPVAYLGLAFFVVAIALFSPWGWRIAPAIARWVRLSSVTIGLAMIVYLVWAELYRIHAICLWCTGVHVITFLLFALTVLAEAAGPEPTSP